MPLYGSLSNHNVKNQHKFFDFPGYKIKISLIGLAYQYINLYLKTIDAAGCPSSKTDCNFARSAALTPPPTTGTADI